MKKIVIRKKSEIQHLYAEMKALFSNSIPISDEDWKKEWDEIDLFALFYHSGKMVGFSAIFEGEFQLSNRKIWGIALGMAVIQPQYRNNYFLQKTLIRRTFRRWFRLNFMRIYLWAHCAHYKSYLALVKSLHFTYPSYRHETPKEALELIQTVGKKVFGNKFDPETLVVTRKKMQNMDEALMPPDKYADDPDIQFYISRMKNYAEGKEGLIAVTPCILKIAPALIYTSMRSAFRRLFGSRRKIIRPQPAEGTGSFSETQSA